MTDRLLAMAYWPAWVAHATGCGIAITVCWATDLVTPNR